MTVKKIERSRIAILESASDTLSINPASSLAEIASAASIGRSTLHRHFASRQELMIALSEWCMTEIDIAVEPLLESDASAKDKILSMFIAIAPLGGRFHFLKYASETMENTNVKAHYQRQIERLDALIEQAVNEGSIHASWPREWVIYLLDSLIYSAWSSLHAGDVAPNTVAKLATQSFLNGLSKPYAS